jgi:cytochrome c
MRSFIATIAFLVISGTLRAEENPSPYGLLVDAPGVEETFGYCTACHSEMIVVQQGKTREHWDKLFEWMVEEQGMFPIEEPDRSIILDYLAEHYNEDRPNFPTP